MTGSPEPIFGRRAVLRASLEIASIVLGVLLALAVSEWQEDRSNAERTRAALINVRNELEGNLEILQQVHDNNAKLVRHLEAAPDSLGDDWQFLPGLQVSDSAWRTLSATGLSSFVDLDLLVSLSETYALVDIYRQTGYALMNANLAVLAQVTAAGETAQVLESSNLLGTNFINHFRLMVMVESGLIDAHQRAAANVSGWLEASL